MSGSTNNKIKAQNKQIEKQFTYDRKFFDYSWQTSLDNFEKSKQLTRLNIANDTAATDYKNKTAADNYRYNVSMQADQYRDEVNAYNRSVSDYRKQKGLNQSAARIALDSERRVRDEALISNMFGRREDSLQFRTAQSDFKYQKMQEGNRLQTMKVDTKLKKNQVDIQQKSQNQIYRQEQKKFDQQDKLIDKKINTTDRLNQLQNNLIDNKIDTAERLNQLQNNKIDQDISSAGERKNQLKLDIQNVKTDRGDINSKQNLIDRQIDREGNMLSDREDISGAKQDILDNSIGKLVRERNATNASDRLDQRMFQEDQASFEEQRQQVRDQSAFQLGDIERKYQQSKAENLGQRMDQYAESLRAKGALAAQGRRGQSADAQQQSALASYGRQQAQMVDSMVFASQDKASASAQNRSKRDFDIGQLNRAQTKSQLERGKQVIARKLKTGNLSSDISSARSEQSILDSELGITRSQSADKTDQLSTDRASLERDKTKLGRNIEKLRSQKSIENNQIKQLKTDKRINRTSTSLQKKELKTEKRINKANTSLRKNELKTEQRLNQANKNINAFQKQQQDRLNANQKSQLEAALDATRSEVNLAKQNINNRMGLNKETWKLNKDKFQANKASANKAYKAAQNKIRLDQYGANLAAKANVMQKPTLPPALPVPREIPKTNFLEPMRPQKPPKPIKGALGKTSIWNDIGDVADVGLKIASFF